MCDSHTCCVFMNVSFVQVLFCLYSCVCLWLRIQVPLRESPWTITGPASLAEQISPEHGCSMLLLVPLYRLAPLPHTPQDCGLWTLTPAPLYRLTLSGPLPHKPKGLGHRAWVDEDWFDDRSLFVRNNGSKYPFVDITWHDYAVFTLLVSFPHPRSVGPFWQIFDVMSVETPCHVPQTGTNDIPLTHTLIAEALKLWNIHL